MQESTLVSVIGLVNLDQSFICIEYPGQVKDPDNVIQTLGGISKMSGTFANEKMRLELKFRPDDIYSKAAFGDRTSTTGVLLKVKIRRPKKDTKSKNSTVSVDVLGRIITKYKFDSLCDFQYLVLHKKNEPNAETEFIYNKIVPEGILPLEWIEENKNAPYFLPPASFTRIDSVQENLFKKEQQRDMNIDSNTIIGRTRTRRYVHATYLSFDLTSVVPSKPHQFALNCLKAKFIPQDNYEKIKALFQKRAIWSKMALQYESNVQADQLKYILPTLAYYYTNGPWRVMWVRYSYDPRKDFESRYLQTFDYRIRNGIGLRNNVKLKRGHTIHKPNVSQKNKVATFIDISQMEEPSTSKQLKQIYSPYFEPGMFPQSRQTFYQYCDIHVPKIQEMLDKIPTPLSGAVCSERTGWFPQGFDDLCRDLISENIKEHHKTTLMKKEEFENDDEEEDELSDEFDYNDDTNLEDQIEDMDIDDLS